MKLLFKKSIGKSIGILFASSLIFHQAAQACSIVGYVGDKPHKSFLQEGLAQLEYRGYDSAGIAYLDDRNDLSVFKASGKLENLRRILAEDKNDGRIGIGHTRWATHGEATEINAHPHTDATGRVAVVHNGVIENHAELKAHFRSLGKEFKSDTDSETIPFVLGAAIDKNLTLKKAMQETVHTLKGAFAFLGVMKDHPGVMVAARKSSPLVIGLGNNETFIASDFFAFASETNKAIYLENETFAIITKDTVEIYDFEGRLKSFEVKTVDVPASAMSKGGYAHYMLKEIYEQRQVVQTAVNYFRSLGSDVWTHLGVSADAIKRLKSIQFFGCGTSLNAGHIGQYYFQAIAKLRAPIHLASEFRYGELVDEEDTLFVGITQSGETADVLETLRFIEKRGYSVSALTNVPTSTVAREACGFLPLNAGREVAVASTKAFTAQVTAMYWLAHRIALEKGLITADQMAKAEDDLIDAGAKLESVIEKYKMEIIGTIAPKYLKVPHFMFLGRHISYPMALEGALKLKEISYILAQGYAAGELKHGPIALVQGSAPTMIFSHQDPKIYEKLLSNAQEVRARKGSIIALAFEHQKELIDLAEHAFVLPEVGPLLEPIVMSGLMQFFTYEIANQLGRNVDMPVNLAKSVTVE